MKEQAFKEFLRLIEYEVIDSLEIKNCVSGSVNLEIADTEPNPTELIVLEININNEDLRQKKASQYKKWLNDIKEEKEGY